MRLLWARSKKPALSIIYYWDPAERKIQRMDREKEREREREREE
jgi:hypothetical protein